MNTADIALLTKSIDDAIALTIVYYKMQGRTIRKFGLRLQDILKRTRIHQAIIDQAKELFAVRQVTLLRDGLEPGELHIEIDLMKVAFTPDLAKRFNAATEERNRAREEKQNAKT